MQIFFSYFIPCLGCLYFKRSAENKPSDLDLVSLLALNKKKVGINCFDLNEKPKLYSFLSYVLVYVFFSAVVLNV